MKTSLTEADIEDTIADESVQKVGQKTTVVVLTLKNGFEVIGSSACVDPNNYNEEIGKQYARKRAIDKVWELEGYSLQKTLGVYGS